MSIRASVREPDAAREFPRDADDSADLWSVVHQFGDMVKGLRPRMGNSGRDDKSARGFMFVCSVLTPRQNGKPALTALGVNQAASDMQTRPESGGQRKKRASASYQLSGSRATATQRRSKGSVNANEQNAPPPSTHRSGGLVTMMLIAGCSSGEVILGWRGLRAGRHDRLASEPFLIDG